MAVDRWWVGGTGNFSDTAHWAASSGGANGQSVPGATDTATIDANSGGGTYTINGNPTVLSFSFVNINKTDVLSLSGSLTIAAGGTLSLTGLSVTSRVSVKSSVLGTPRTITVPSGATITATNWAPQDIVMAGTFSTGATASSIGDKLGNTWGWSSVQPNASVALTWDHTATGAQNWSTNNWLGTTSRVPLPQDDVTLPAMDAATTLTADQPTLGRNITATNYDRTLSFASTPNTLFGNVALGANGTFSGTQGLTLAGRGAQTITSNTKTFPQAVDISAFGGTYSLQDDFSILGSFTNTMGSFTSNDHAISVSTYSVPSTGTPVGTVNFGASIVSLSGTTGTRWDFRATNLVLLASSSTIKFTGNNTTSVTVQGGGKIYGTFWWSSTTSTGTLIIAGANRFKALQNDSSSARTIQVPNGVTQTIDPGGMQLAGSAGKALTLKSDSAGLPATLSCTGGDCQSTYLTVQDITATGGTNWRDVHGIGGAGSNGNVSGNTGWTFGAVSVTNSATMAAASAESASVIKNAKPSVAMLCAAAQNGTVVKATRPVATIAASANETGSIARTARASATMLCDAAQTGYPVSSVAPSAVFSVGASESGAAMRNGVIDAIFSVSGAVTGAILEQRVAQAIFAVAELEAGAGLSGAVVKNNRLSALLASAARLDGLIGRAALAQAQLGAGAAISGSAEYSPLIHQTDELSPLIESGSEGLLRPAITLKIG